MSNWQPPSDSGSAENPYARVPEATQPPNTSGIDQPSVSNPFAPPQPGQATGAFQPQAGAPYAGGPYASQANQGAPYAQPQYPNQQYQGPQSPGQPYMGPQFSSQQSPGQPYSPPQYFHTQVAQPEPTSGLAIAALVTGLLGMGLVAIGLGIAGVVQTNRTKQPGRGMAIAGIVIGAVSLIVQVIFVVAAVRAFDEVATEYPSAPTVSTSVLVEACGDGDMEACDSLFWQSEVGSDDEEFASTCGGLDPAGSHAGNCAD